MFISYGLDLCRCLVEQGQHFILATGLPHDGFLGNNRFLENVCIAIYKHVVIKVRRPMYPIRKTNPDLSCRARFGLYLHDALINIYASAAHFQKAGMN